MADDKKPPRARKSRSRRGDGAVFYSESKGCWVWRAVTGTKPDGGVAYTEGRARTQAAGVKAKREAERSGRLPGGGETVGAYIDAWLNGPAKSATRGNSWRRYEQCVRLHIKPHVGGVPLAKLDTRTVNKLWGDLTRAGAKPGTVKKVATVLSACLEHAVRESVIPTAPTRSATKPKVIQQPVEVFSADEVRGILAAAAGHRLEALFVLVAASGMRQGELFGLEVGDVDLAAGTVHVRRSLDYYNGTFTVNPPKSANGVRVIDLPTFAVDALRAHVAGRKSGTLFTTSEGTRLVRTNFLERDWTALLVAAKVPYRRFHIMRHTHASALLTAGVDVAEVARRIGDTVATLTKTYSHWMKSAGRDTASKVQALYGNR